MLAWGTQIFTASISVSYFKWDFLCS
uniref:Uncharacterized protein n=1 Tax=Rhizophora mucronata TaxID=61149 RepID=A0A2P2QN42_RHIMU